MIISDTYKYLFIEFPQTGCSAVGRELMEHYDGKRILYKHAQLHNFMQQASEEQKKYFSFSTIRNPMDVVVSKYFKYKSDHENYATKKVKHGKLRKLIMPSYERARHNYIVEQNADFESFFLKYYHWPYSAWSIMGHHQLDHVMRFENLSADFAQVLRKIGISPVRELPLFNKTGDKKEDFTSYFKSPEARRRAIEIFGPYMKEWGYTFPADWPELKTTAPAHGKYKMVNTFRKAYWKYLR